MKNIFESILYYNMKYTWRKEEREKELEKRKKKRRKLVALVFHQRLSNNKWNYIQIAIQIMYKMLNKNNII